MAVSCLPRALVAALAGVVLVLACAQAQAGTRTSAQNVRAKGYGASPQEAVQDALVRVLQQHKGVRIDARQVHSTTLVSGSVVENGAESSAAALKDAVQKQVATATKGAISEYRVLDGGIGEDGLHWAEVEATFRSSTYQAPGLPSDKRRRFAVYPFAAAREVFRVDSGDVSGLDVAHALTDALIAQLVQTRKFAVLQRRDLSAYGAESAVVGSAAAGRDERLKLGKLLGADYLLTGAVTSCGADTRGTTSALTGERLSGGNVEIGLSYELMLMATQEIKWADTLTFAVELPGNARRDSALAGAFDALANRVVMDLLENIYPPRIVAAQGGEVQLNLGGKSYAPGDVLDVYALGAPIVDPYTKESLGAVETLVGTVEIVRVTPKLAYARAVSGAPLAVGMVCRRQGRAPGAAATGTMGTGVEMQPGGGVKLPFD
jgi:TolB-like protein